MTHNNQLRCLIVGSLPAGKGGMENIINCLANSSSEHNNPLISYSTLYFDYHNRHPVYCQDKITSWPFRKALISPLSFIPRKIQECIIIWKIIKFVQQFKPHALICLDDKSCKYCLAVAKNLKIKHPFAKITWLHRSIETFRHKSYFLQMDFHISISKGIVSQLSLLGISSKKIAYIPNCYNLPCKYNFTSYPEDTNTYLYVGRIEFYGQKQIQILIRAFSLLSQNCVLHIVGTGSDKDLKLCNDLCDSLKISNRVIFHGWQSNPWKYLYSQNITNITALCLTSAYEGFPLVLIEAMAQGIFCIATDCPTGPKDVVNSTTGLLAKAGDTDDFALKMKQAALMDHDTNKIISSTDQYSKEIFLSTFEKTLIDAISHEVTE